MDSTVVVTAGELPVTGCLCRPGRTLLATDGKSPKPGLVRFLSVCKASTAAWRTVFWASADGGGTGDPIFRPYVNELEIQVLVLIQGHGVL